MNKIKRVHLYISGFENSNGFHPCICIAFVREGLTLKNFKRKPGNYWLKKVRTLTHSVSFTNEVRIPN